MPDGVAEIQARVSIVGPRFQLGQIVATIGVIEGMAPAEVAKCLARHARCDWGDVDREDSRTNDRAVRQGMRIVSAYDLDAGTLWIITEADRSVTTCLLPSEY